MRKNLFTLFCCLLTTVGTFAYSVGDIAKSYALPIYFKSTTQYGSITQQIHLASELTSQGGKAGQNISSITFYYSAKDGASVSALSRPIQVWILSIPSSTTEYVVDAVAWQSGAGYDGYSHFLCDGNNKPGTLVYTGNLSTEEVTSSPAKSVKLTFNENDFRWDGTSNIAITICDQSTTAHTIDADSYANLRFSIQYTGVETPRFLCKQWKTGDTDTRSAWLSNLLIDYGDFYPHDTGNRSVQKQKENRSWVNKIDFAFEDAPAPTVPSIPEDLAASNVGSTSASLSWSAVEGATSYDLYHSTSAEGIYTEFASPTTNSYDWSELTASTTYYVKVAAVNGAGSSALSEPISFTTLAPHIHDGITFEPWSNPAALPTSGTYYLANDVYEESATTLTGNLNLCLNGKTATLLSNIIIPSGYTLTIYDNEGSGSISGYYESAPLSPAGLITIESGGALVIGEGAIQNLDVDPEEGYSAYAIYNQGTLHMSGNPVITAATADIYLFSSKYITLDGELTNTSKYKVNAAGQVITSGWSTHMSGEKPSDYFTSAKSGYRGICVVNNEVKFVKLLALDEEEDNADISDGTYAGTICVSMTRSLTSSQYNTFCLPFALTDAQLQEYFGAGYDLEEFVSSSLEGDVLSLEFSKVTSLEAGKPYLLKPSLDVVNPSFEGVTITATSPADQTSDEYISFHATYAPTDLEGGNRNILFLGSGNELFWPASDGQIKAFRAYFEVKGDAQKAAKRARIVKKEDAATGIQNTEHGTQTQKVLRNGEIFILCDGKTYNVLGMECK